MTASLSGALLAAGLALPLAAPTPALASPGQTAPASLTSPQTAVAQAKQTGKQVGIPSLTTPTETVAANPNGTLTLTQSVYPTRVKRNGAWVPLDTTLHIAADGSLQAAAVPSGVALSGGGTAPLATLTSVGRSLSLTWPDALPQPTISGSTATYADVMPGVDLEVTVTPLGGFSDVLVVKDAAAAANPDLDTLTLATHSTGLTVVTGADGSVSVTDRKGAPVFAAPTALMWDSSTQTAGATAASTMATAGLPGTAAAGQVASPPQPDTPSGNRSSVRGPGQGAEIAKVAAVASHGHLDLTPDKSILRGRDTHFPVYIDPDMHPVPASDSLSSYDEIQQGCPDKNALNSGTEPYNTPGVGENDYSGCIGIERALYQFKVDPHLRNSSVRIIDATFKAKEVYSASCSVTSDVNVSLISAIGLSTTWNTRPALGTLQDTQSYGNACSSNPSQGFNVLDAFAKAHGGGWSSVALAMTAASETDALDFRRFSNNPTVTVDYNTLPSVASATTSPDAARIGHTTITLNAYVTDPDAGAGIQAKFTLVGKDTSGAIVYPKQGVEPSAQVTQRGSISWRVGYLPTGTYTWTVQADDGDTQGSPSVVTKTFTVDATAPGAPDVCSPQIPAPCNPNSVPTPPARTQLEFDISPPDGATDIAYYAYNWGTPPPTVNAPLTIAPDAGKLSATLHAIPAGFVHDQLFVYAVDKAGNQSVPYNFDFDTLAPSGHDATGDLTGDGTPDLLIPGSDGNLRLYQGTGNGNVTSPVNLWNRASGSTDFTGAQIAVGAFSTNAEQDVLVLTSTGQADVYAGNGDGEPLPWTTTTQESTNTQLSQNALLESPTDPNTNQPITGLQWTDVTGIAADDSQHDQGAPPNLWLVSKDGGLYWATGTTAFGDFNPPVLISSNFQNTAIAYAGLVNGNPALWALNTSTHQLTLYTGTGTGTGATPAGADSGTPGTAVNWPPAPANTSPVAAIYSAGATSVASDVVPPLWATDAQAARNIYSYPASTSAGSLRPFLTRTQVQTVNPNDDFTGDGQADIAAEWGDGTLHLYTGEGGGKLTGSGQIWDSSWSSIRAMVSSDFTGDGKSDIIAVWADGTLHRYDGTGTGGLNTPVTLFSGNSTWDTVREITAGDFNGDGSTDLVAVWNDGSLHLYTNQGHGTFNAPVSFWKDNTWSGMRLLSGSDYNGDGNSDLLAVQTSTGNLFLYVGDGNGHLANGVQSAIQDWTTIKDIIPGDFSGDGKTDLAAIWSDGTLHLYTGSGTGSFTATGTMWPDTSWLTIKLAT